MCALIGTGALHPALSEGKGAIGDLAGRPEVSPAPAGRGARAAGALGTDGRFPPG